MAIGNGGSSSGCYDELSAILLTARQALIVISWMAALQLKASDFAPASGWLEM